MSLQIGPPSGVLVLRAQVAEGPELKIGGREGGDDLPGAGLEPAWSCLRGIFVLATAFAAESCNSFGVWTFSLPLSGVV